MTSRFLTVAAIAGMLLAAGCGGGAGTSTSGLTPTTPGGGASAPGGSNNSANGSSFAVSFQVPMTAAELASYSSASASSRQPAYISPASSGVQILLGITAGSLSPCANSFAVGTQAAPIALSPAGAANVNLTTGACGVNSTSSPFVAGTAQLSGNIPCTGAGCITNLAVGATFNVNTIPGSATTTPVMGQTFTITNTDNPAAGVITATVNTVPSGSIGSGFLMQGKVVGVVAGTNSAGWTTGNVINFQAGSTTQSTYTYTFTPQVNTTAGSGATGYYNATFTFNNMTGAQTYNIGVVLTDITVAGYPILSENLENGAVNATGPTVFPAMSLKPVVWGVWLTTPTAVGAALVPPANSFESTVSQRMSAAT